MRGQKVQPTTSPRPTPPPISNFRRLIPRLPALAIIALIVGPGAPRQAAAFRIAKAGSSPHAWPQMTKRGVWLMLIRYWTAAVLAQGFEPELFAETEGWSIARQGSACLMTREFGVNENSMLTVAVDPADGQLPLTLMIGDNRWALPEADAEGYRIEFGGTGAIWQQLAVHTFTTNGDADGQRDGVISIGFAHDAIVPMLDDMADSTDLQLSHDGVAVIGMTFEGNASAVQKFGRLRPKRAVTRS